MGRSRTPDRRRSRSRDRRSRDRSRDRDSYRDRRSPPRYREQRPEKVSLLVRNLDDRTHPEEVKEYFQRFGTVKDVYCPLDYYTKRPKGFAFVEFLHYDDARDAKNELDRKEFQGRIIDVVFAQQRRKTADQMRSRDGGGYDRGGRYSRSPPRRRSPSPQRRERSRDRRDRDRRDDRDDRDRRDDRDDRRDDRDRDDRDDPRSRDGDGDKDETRQQDD